MNIKATLRPISEYDKTLCDWVVLVDESSARFGQWTNHYKYTDEQQWVDFCQAENFTLGITTLHFEPTHFIDTVNSRELCNMAKELSVNL